MKTKIFAPALLCVLCFSVLISCGGSPGDAGPDTGTVSSPAETEAVTDPLDALEAEDYGGYAFTVLSVPDTNYQIYAEEMTGEIFNDAMYERQSMIADRYNIIFGSYEAPAIEKISVLLGASVLAGDDAYDICIPHVYTHLASMMTDGLLFNLNGLPNIDMDAEWWNASLRETFDVNGYLCYVQNSFRLPNVGCFLFNKAYIAEYGRDDPYRLVLDGKWTLDALISTCKGISEDLNGDGNRDENDRYGFVYPKTSNAGAVNFMYGADQLVIGRDTSEGFMLALEPEKMAGLMEKVHTLFYEDNIARLSPVWENDRPDVDLSTGRSFMSQYLIRYGRVNNYRDTEVDFGILPYPKYDEAQEGYYNGDCDGLICVPETASDPGRTGLCLEALAILSHRDVVPVFYENILGQKMARDEESVEMLNIIYSGAVYDIGRYFDNGLGLSGIVPAMISAKTTDFASRYAKLEVRAAAQYEALYLDFYEASQT